MSDESTLYEQLAAQEHTRWARWMDYLFSVGTFNADGTWTMPAWAVDRWRRQAATGYADLTEAEKDSDRAEARQTLALLRRRKEQDLEPMINDNAKGTIIVGQPLPQPPPETAPANSWNSERPDPAVMAIPHPHPGATGRSGPLTRSAGVVTEIEDGDGDDAGVVLPPGPPGAPVATLDAIVCAAEAVRRAVTRVGSRAERRSAPARFDWAAARADVEAARQAVEQLAQLVYGEKD